MNFPYKIGIDRFIGSCNSENIRYYKICLADIVKNISVKSLDLISREFVLKNISFHHSCKCGCLLDEKVCNNLQKWNKNKCRCECLNIKKCKIRYSWHVNNCRCEMKKLARLIDFEECDVETNEKIEGLKNKTVVLIESERFPKNCKPFIGVSILFFCVTIILSGIMIYFCLKLKNNFLPY